MIIKDDSKVSQEIRHLNEIVFYHCVASKQLRNLIVSPSPQPSARRWGSSSPGRKKKLAPVIDS